MNYLSKISLYSITLVILISLSSCKTKTNYKHKRPVHLSAKNVIKQFYINDLDIRYLNGRITVEQLSNKKEKPVSLSIRIKKDSILWISAGFGLLKLKITPTEINYYNKLKKNYFTGDFSFLNKKIGINFSFNDLEAILLAKPIFPLIKKKYQLNTTNDIYTLSQKMNRNPKIYNRLQISSISFNLLSQEFIHPSENLKLKIDYIYKNISDEIPTVIEIITVNQQESKTYKIKYNHFQINQKIRFPFKIPSNYKKLSTKDL